MNDDTGLTLTYFTARSNWVTYGLSAPASGLYIHVYDHNFQTSSLLKPLGQSKPFFVEPPWEGGTKFYINGPGHMTKMAATPISGKNLQKSSSPEPEVL